MGSQLLQEQEIAAFITCVVLSSGRTNWRSQWDPSPTLTLFLRFLLTVSSLQVTWLSRCLCLSSAIDTVLEVRLLCGSSLSTRARFLV